VSGFTYDMLYDLYFTPERVIVVMVQNPGDMMPSTSWTTVFVSSPWTRHVEKEKRDEMTASQRGWMRDLSPDDMLAKSERNYQIRYNNVVSVEIKRGIFQSTIKFKTNKNVVYSFNLQKDMLKEARRLLEKSIPPALLK